MGDKLDELLRRDNNRALLEGFKDAEHCVDRSRAALTDIERQEAEARLAREEVRRLEKWHNDVICSEAKVKHKQVYLVVT